MSPVTERLRLRHIEIKDFKGIEELSLDFPEPRFEGDPDILVMGSENGIGKTSVLEAISLGLLAGRYPRQMKELVSEYGGDLDVFDYFLNGRSYECRVLLTVENEECVKDSVVVRLLRHGEVFASSSKMLVQGAKGYTALPPDTLSKLIGLSTDPLTTPPVMYFHSFRKVREGRVDLSSLISETPKRRQRRATQSLPSTSAIKIEILRALMERGALFEHMTGEELSGSINFLNDLLEEFVQGRIEKLRPSDAGGVDPRVTSLASGASFSFDGLSSGQKEIISTIFTIWKNTRERGAIVLIDEPELHLNAQWHKLLIRRLTELMPQNQYIIATHSEDVFAAVPAENRVILRNTAR